MAQVSVQMVEDFEENGNSKMKLVDSILSKKLPDVTEDVYGQTVLFEEGEAAERNGDQDLLLYREACSTFVELVDEIDKLKTTKPEDVDDIIEEKRIEGSLITVYLKKLNRYEKLRTKNTRDNINRVKQQVETYQLQLENLLCEILHLKKEVDKCLNFKSKDLGIELVPLQQFYNEAPDEIARPDVTKVDEHQQQLARLEWELKERKQLALLCGELESKKQVVAEQIRNKKIDLDSLIPFIRDVLNATKPMQESLGLSVNKSSCNQEVVSLLPHPLYYLYVQSEAYREACDKRLSVSVTGDEEEAKIIKQGFTDVISTEDSDSDGQEEEEEEEEEEHKIRRKKSRIVRKEEKQNRLLMKHPLSVGLKVYTKSGDAISLQFYYLTNLNVLTVVPVLELKLPVTSQCANQLLCNNTILSSLFPDDIGIDSPNMANYYQLQEAGLGVFDTEQLGLPYVWVQRVGGLNFRSQDEDKIIEANREISQTSIPNVIKEIRRRLQARIALASQIIALEKSIVTGPNNMSSVKLSCELKKWQILSWEEYNKLEFTSKLIGGNDVTQNDIFYKALITRADAKLTLLVAIHPSYPCSAPVFSISLEWNNSSCTASNNNNLRDIEREVNVYWKELVSEGGWGYTLLSRMVHRLMVSFDIMLECEAPQQFSNEKKTFSHPFSGRNRAHPYKFVPVGDGIFMQR